jgi:hypothetical protein
MKRFLFLSLFALTACGTQPQLSEIVNDMVVLTNFDEEVDFSQYVTYGLTMDTVGFVSNTTNNEALLNNYTKMITSNIKKNLDQTGHVQVDAGSPADIAVNVVIFNDLSISQSYYPGYYGGYPYGGYYGGYYGGGYYGGGYVQTNINQQAILVIEFLDIKTAHAGDPPVIWVANIGDLVNSFDTSTKTREAIDQAFVQSPYLEQ